MLNGPSNHYAVIVISSGPPGGASLADRLAPTEKRILLLERGEYLPRSPANWNAQTVFGDGAYGCALLSLYRRGKPDANDHRECARVADIIKRKLSA